jgi:hypothetical protein
MPIDQQRLGVVVQEQMTAIEADHPDDDCEIGKIAVIVEVVCPGDQEGQIQRELRIRSDPEDIHARLGLLLETLKDLLRATG